MSASLPCHYTLSPLLNFHRELAKFTDFTSLPVTPWLMSHLYWNCCSQGHLLPPLLYVQWKLFSPYLSWPLGDIWYCWPFHPYYNSYPKLEEKKNPAFLLVLEKIFLSLLSRFFYFCLFLKYWCSNRLCLVPLLFTLYRLSAQSLPFLCLKLLPICCWLSKLHLHPELLTLNFRSIYSPAAFSWMSHEYLTRSMFELNGLSFFQIVSFSWALSMIAPQAT